MLNLHSKVNNTTPTSITSIFQDRVNFKMLILKDLLI